MPPFFAYLYYVQEPEYNDKGELKPEERMPVPILGAFLVPICIFWFGWTSRSSVHWIVSTIGSSLFSIAALLLFNAILNSLADAYSTYAASVLVRNEPLSNSANNNGRDRLDLAPPFRHVSTGSQWWCVVLLGHDLMRRA